MLYACYDLIPVDVVMEVSWRHGLNDYTMVGAPYGSPPRGRMLTIEQPFMINAMREQNNKIAHLEKENENRKSKETQAKETEDSGRILGNPLLLTAGPAMGTPSAFGNGLSPQPTGFRGF